MHVVDGLPAPLRDRCTVDRRRHHPTDLMTQLSTCDVVISMRLHGCLLAMIAGTPAMGLAYESKTPEIRGPPSWSALARHTGNQRTVQARSCSDIERANPVVSESAPLRGRGV
ncbi:MAG TPA: polysaccharide pyruvyl transferase family protein, partial [Vicinamibacterales bacterium]|nr:polysaccharide pyruvyl transferase family protein [Vicinamibacterales bacterium]